MKNEMKAKLSKLLQTVRLQPQTLQAKFLLGQTYLLNGDKQSARNQVKKVASLDSQMAKILYAAIYGNPLIAAEK